MKHIIIAIDGPAGAGKSTTARLVAEQLGYTYIDTGAMYRAATLLARRQQPPTPPEDIPALLESHSIELRWVEGRQCTLLDGLDVSEEIRSPEVTNAVSAVSAVEGVRHSLVRAQRRFAESGGVVMDGRDIGTHVFPDAELKIFLVADPMERARRRALELRARGQEVNTEALAAEIAHRDEQDSLRAVSPLRKAPDAVEIDTTHLTIEQQVQAIVSRARAILSLPAAT